MEIVLYCNGLQIANVYSLSFDCVRCLCEIQSHMEIKRSTDL